MFGQPCGEYFVYHPVGFAFVLLRVTRAGDAGSQELPDVGVYFSNHKEHLISHVHLWKVEQE